MDVSDCANRRRRMLPLAHLLFSSAMGCAAVPAIASPPQTQAFAPYAQEPGATEHRVTVSGEGLPGKRSFTLSSTAPQRDNGPAERTIVEEPGAPFVTTTNSMFDALFAQAIDDARKDSVTAIRDEMYNGGKPIDCHCFETGEKWTYVWTRDLSYALDLGLAGFDPERAVDSLLFKTSGFRAGVAMPAGLPAGSTQIVQDTGSGGSWPVSTDRTAWALGAESALANLSGPARSAFAAKAYAALRGTVEADRIAAFDPRDGLYGGEHSFLDWREQTYGPWIIDDLVPLAQSKALSTNVLQMRALRLTARLADDSGEKAVAARYAGWADALGQAINAKFWVQNAGLYATYTTAEENAPVAGKYDLLGNMLAIEAGLADSDRARLILSRYPFAAFGPPVVWPQQPDVFVYHNRAQWPFVTAYLLKAAAKTGHVEAADRAISALMRSASLHLSNMENLEWLTGRSLFDDGPLVNSRRQLWSVGGYYGMVVGTIFGWQPEREGVRIAPFLTSRTRKLLGAGNTVQLKGLRYAGKPVEIVLHLPAPAPDGGIHDVAQTTLNGRAFTGALTATMLASTANRVDVTFAAARKVQETVTEIAPIPALSHDDPRGFMPATPPMPAVDRSASATTVHLPPTAAGTGFAVWRDGRMVGNDLSGGDWVDPAPVAGERTVCYSIRARYRDTGLESLSSPANCLRGSLAQTVGVDDRRVGGTATRISAGDGVAVSTLKLALGKSLIVSDLQVTSAGRYALAVLYDNHVFATNTGVTNAVKRLTITDEHGGVQQAIVQMPHIRPIGEQHPLRLSTRSYVALQPGRYTLKLDDFFNMSALASNGSYNGPGGTAGPVNEAGIAAIHVDFLGQ